MSGQWSGRARNPKFPHCAEVARRMLAEVAGCKPGDLIPSEAELLDTAAAVRDGRVQADFGDRAKADVALAILDEIGGL